ncbi:MAG: transglycosylase SLT domain-containing protein [Nanoarchaeota archaeon]|nr:transglycosylase SLT domain-containing protein [Nanoarchaeota archaeon]
MVELCDEFKESYSNSKKDVGFCEGYRLSSSEISIRDIVINSRLKTISFEGVYEPNIDDYSVKLRINKEDVDLGLNDVFYMGDFGTGVGSEGGNWKIDRGPDEIKTILKKTSGYSDCIKYIDDVSAAGKKYEIDPLLLFALMKHESNCNSDASNTNKDKKGNPISLNMDIGLMQVNTKAHCGEKRDGEELSSDFRNCVGELYDKTRNIYVGADILKTSYLATKNGKEYNVCGRNILYSGWEAALRGYNGWGCYPGQGYYVEDVTKLFNDLGGGFSASTITGDQGSEYIKLTELTENYAKFDIHVKESEVKETVWKTDAMTLDLNQFKTVGNYNFRLIDINLKKFAQVSVIPSIDYAGTKANFSFRLGIEQRTFKLTPEKTKEKISVLDKSISDFESTTEELGKFVKTMNRACVVTGTGLMLKNLVNNAGGKAIARKQVMRSEGGWYQTCADLVSKGTYKNVDVCLADNSDAIEKHVERYYNDMKLQEQECADIQDKYTKKGVLGQRTVDDEAYLKECIAKTKLSVLNNLETMFPNGVPYEGGMISAQQFVNTINENTTTIEEWRDLSLNSRFNNDEGLLSNMAKKSAQSSINDIYKTSSLIKETEDAKVNIDANSNLKNVGLTVVSLQNTQIFPYEGGEVVVSNFGNISVDSKIQKVLYEGNVYTLKLNEFETNKYRVEEVYNEDGSTIPLVASREILSRRDKIKQTLVFEKVDASRYENKYLNPVVRYFETEPYKGEPALVPVDVKNGWYVVMKQTLPVLGNIQTYDASGIPRSFYLCNVGKNGNEENRKYPDDECGLINFGTGQPVDEFSGLSKEKASALVSEARKAIEDAQKAHKSGARSVSIKGQTIEVGEPMADIPDIQCQDTMSASDCKLLFNVCDPVVCPSSRCNLGGKYNVENVIQSGITGGIFLCAPNFIGFGGDVVIPVCLSGIHAGLDGWVQIQKSYRDCLQDSLDTGQMTGICDEIYSLHGCEFLWRQGIPAAKLIIPKFLEVITGQNVKGGGEYLGMQTALKNAGDSVSYFTNYYAKNSFAAFKARSTEEVGSVFCKNFISGTFPNFDSVMDVLTEPVSPVQFHGRFEEILYTTATNPPMSQYKVWYFIYAGKDSGSYYQVYLTGAPETSYYQDTGLKKIIASGYLSAGERIDEAPDLLATSGYQQLCIRVNEQEECGFKQVSTEFGVTYVKDLYMKEQASQENIKTEKNCIAGTASLYSLASPSGEGAADELLNPSIYNRGIIRICATNNPGKSTDANWQDPEKSRWKDVGYCDDNTMRCWLDKKSVENVIENQAFEDEVLEKHAQNQLDILINQGGYFSGSEFTQAVTKLKELENKKSYSEIISSVNSIFERAFLNNQKAKLLFLRGNAFAELAKGLFKGVVDEKVGVAGIGSSSTQAGREMDGFDEQIVKGGPGCCNYKTASMKESVCSVERSSCDSVQAMWIEEGGCIENNKKCVSREEFAAAQKCSDVCDGLLNTCDINECHEQDGYGLNCFFVDSLSDTCVDCDNLAFCSQLSDDNEKCLDSRCGGKLGCVWESNGCVKKGWEVVQVNVKLTLEKAIEETKTRKGKYSENKDFVDQLYNISILTEEEYVEINGKGFWDVFNVEEDMNYLLKILLLKLATQRKAEIDQSFLDIENELEYDLEVQNINEFVEIRYVLNQTSTFPDLYFGYYEKTSPLRWVWTIDSGLEKWFAVSTIDEMLNNPQKNNQLKYLLGDVNSKTDLIRSLQGKDYDSGKILVLNAGGKGL